ncbi:MAG: hypothetical protein IH577_01250 [Deltaproteobacteria bacterium]|nr:hypothetical protein [Deltaproteobacteria bacterium]
MKTNLVRMAVLVLAAVTIAAPAFAGRTQAEREMAKGNLGGQAGHDASVQTPDPNDWEYRVALETGSLLPDVGTFNAGSGPAVDVPTVEAGGNIYRVGIDTN